MRILVVDDDKIIRMGLGKKIKRLFNEHDVIDNFQNGNDALDYLKKNEVELVITDIKMPVMSGIELIKEAEKTLEKTPLFIVLSGYDDFSYVRDSMKHGAVNYLLKPVVEDELKKALTEAEIEIELCRKKEKIINRSIDILRKDFFRYLLFSNRVLNSKDEKKLRNTNLNENYIYKMIVISKLSENITKEINDFISAIVLKFEGVKYTYYFFEEEAYLIFYYEDHGCMGDILELDISCESDVFIKKNLNIYIFEGIKDVWKLRENAAFVQKFKDTEKTNIKGEKYFFRAGKDLSIMFAEKEKDASKTSIKLAKEYIINNYYKNISLKTVADEIFLSQNYLSELFKKETGEGFYEFLSNYRIKKAKEILITTNLKVYEIAERVGYSDSITFGRAFKKKTGKTPNHYRNDILCGNRGE